MPTITLTDIFHVLVDGRDVGHIIDAVRSVPPRADPVEMKAAFDMWFVKHANLCREAIADAKAEAATLRDKHATHCAQLESDIAALGTKEEAQAIRKQQDITKIRAQIAADTTRLAELSK